MREKFDNLAAQSFDDTPVLSVYLDMRPQATQGSPGQRSAETFLADRLGEIRATMPTRTAARDSFDADAVRIEDYIRTNFDVSKAGFACFACHAHELFQTFETAQPFENQVAFRPAADLYQLAALMDAYEAAVIAVVDTNTARLFVQRYGRFNEVGGPDDTNKKRYTKTAVGGWSQKRYQRTIDNNRAEFASESAHAIEQLVAREGATRLILAGNEVALPLLRDALSPNVQALVYDEPVRIDIRASEHDVADEVWPILAEIEAEQSQSVADRLVSQVRGNNLGVAGVERTRAALRRGQVDTLVIDSQAGLDEGVRSELVSMAAASSAAIEVVDGHAALGGLGGVGGLLRYQF